MPRRRPLILNGGQLQALPRPDTAEDVIVTPWTKRVCSEWRSGSVASGAATVNSLRAMPFRTQGRPISSVDFHIQTAAAAGTEIHLALYAADENGLPSVRLWKSDAVALQPLGAGTKSVAVAPNLESPSERVWLAHYIPSGGTQFATGGSSGAAEREFGLPTGAAVNAAITSLLSDVAWAGGMPEAFSYNAAGTGISTGGSVPNFFIGLV